MSQVCQECVKHQSVLQRFDSNLLAHPLCRLARLTMLTWLSGIRNDSVNHADGDVFSWRPSCWLAGVKAGTRDRQLSLPGGQLRRCIVRLQWAHCATPRTSATLQSDFCNQVCQVPGVAIKSSKTRHEPGPILMNQAQKKYRLLIWVFMHYSKK